MQNISIIINGEEYVKKETVTKQEFPVWKTITVGNFSSMKDILETIKSHGVYVTVLAEGIALKSEVSKEKKEVQLFCATVEELGFSSSATWKEIRERVVKLGYKFCPAEAGPQLRLQYLDQPSNEWLWLVMEPSADAGSHLHVFRVARDAGVRYLFTDDGRPGDVLLAGYRVVFSRR